MPHLLYIHGFLSSPRSHKAVQTQGWLQEHRPDVGWHCPFLTPYPAATLQTLVEAVEAHREEGLGLIGSSLGGYWATWLAERYDLRAVLINPAVKPSMLKPDYVNVELKNYHTGDTYILKEEDIDNLLAVNVDTVTLRDNYWLLVQTGDETLDFRDAVQKYAGCRQLVEEGGDHSFQGYEKHLPAIIRFLDL